MSIINPGDRLIHYIPNSKRITGCTVEITDSENIIVNLDKQISRKTRLIIPWEHYGKWLFHEEKQIEFGMELVNRKIDNIVHFTRLGNLRSILKHGIVPRNNQEFFNIKSVCNDVERFDCRLDATSCSITFPNDRIFRSFRDNKYPNEKWVVLILDAKVILSTENVCEFFLTNAANKIMRSQSGFELRHFQNMFNNEITIQKSDGSSYTCIRQQMPDNFTTDVQDEILIRGKIEKYYIKKVVFDAVETKNEWYANNSDIANDFCLDIMPEYFGWRTNFRG